MQTAESNWAEVPRAGKILLLGLGNDLLTDDAVGLQVVSQIRDSPWGHSDIFIAESSEMGLALLDLVIGFETLILVDAIHTGRVPPGFVLELHDEELSNLTGASPHFLGIAELLALGRELGLAVPSQVSILAIEVEDPFTIGRELTPTMRASLPGIVKRVSNYCEGIVQSGYPTS